MSLHIEKIGQGEPLVMIHGWGMHSGMWMQARDLLSQHFELHLVDLPGMGYSKNLDIYNLHSVAEEIAEAIPNNAYVLGWSLGGLIATKVALITPIKKLILVGSTPCFVARDDWQQGMPSDVFESFFAGALQDYQGTMNKLLALIAMGSGNARATTKMLREALSFRPEPNQQGLLGALDILRTGDLRADLPSIETPSLLIHGVLDKLASLSAAEWTAKALPNAELIALPNAAHEPFISYPELFTQKVTEFLRA
ncbi:MAG: pimeloyl-ACP methyl ester esterase BioH [Burkholderiaceae bacterium]|jgi:pimeloyl-[acyl-carrier protein] methyl ester esterase|nr:pimeloyl-ACP methyl ester esterase BioH [Burkholderiaceae bacterium]